MQVRKLGLRRNKEGGRNEGRVGYKEAPKIKIKKKHFTNIQQKTGQFKFNNKKRFKLQIQIFAYNLFFPYIIITV